VLPHYGIMGAAIVSSASMVASRGLITPWLLTRHLRLSYSRFMLDVLAPPILSSLPVWGLLLALRRMGVPGRRVAALAVIGAASSAIYLGICYFTCLTPQHRQLGRSWLRNKLVAPLRSVLQGNAAGS